MMVIKIVCAFLRGLKVSSFRSLYEIDKNFKYVRYKYILTVAETESTSRHFVYKNWCKSKYTQGKYMAPT